MARRKVALAKFLKLLSSGPLPKGMIRKNLGISRKTEYVIVKESLDNCWIEMDKMGNYRLTPSGAAQSDFKTIPTDQALFLVYSQVIDPISYRKKRPYARCTLIIDDATEIKKLDSESYNSDLYIQELPENATPINAALSKVIDSIFDLRAKEMGLYMVRNMELAQSFSIFDSEKFPGYDYLRRYEKLADIDFKLIIEFEGKKWVRNQSFADLWSEIERNSNLYKEAGERIKREELGIRVSGAMKQLEVNNDDKQMAYLGLFKTKQDLVEYVTKIFSLYYISNKKQDVRKAFESGLMSYEKKTLYHLNINSKRIENFCNMINSPKK
jgi:hypothetical protein